jgi:leader peptidase (prepilin peptidase)/N-methyltransferase
LFRYRRPYRALASLLLVGYLAIAAAYVLVAGWVTASGHLQATGHWHGSFSEASLPRINDVIIFTFFLVCGASVGSFLNVVVWRMPQGLSVNGHSFCPRCRTTLRPRDNVPVFGWLWLGGRCRDCRLPISSRYPIVEAAVGLTFACVGFVELNNWNLPDRSHSFGWSMVAPMVSGGQLATTLFHLVGLAIAWAMGLIRYDGHRIPGRLVGFSAVWLVGGLLVFPSLAIVPWQFIRPTPWPPQDWLLAGHVALDPAIFVQAGVRILTAFVAAGFFARVLAKAFCPRADLKLDPLGDQTSRLVDLVILIAVVALLVGWQATSGVLIASSLLARFLRQTAVGRVSKTQSFSAMGQFALSMPIVLTLQIVFWRALAESQWWPSEQASRPVLLGFSLGTLLIPLWLRDAPDFASTPEKPQLDSESEGSELPQ